MSYPPQGNQYPPPPGEPYGQQPQYGQQPAYGQAPQYGEQPAYGQAPQYGQAPYGQGVSTNYASWIQRVGGYIIDVLVVAPFSILATVLGTDTVNGVVQYNAMYWVFTLLSLILNGYNRWYLGGKTGQSWGRKALGLRLVGDETGQPIGVGKAFLRDIPLHWLDSLACFIGWLFPLWDAKRQTFADKILKTVVVK